MQHKLTTAKRLVIKVGSALLVDDATGKIHQRWLASFIADIATLVQQGKQVILVSSGAIALGRRQLKLTRQHLLLEQKQAAAATGQIVLAHAYQEALAEQNIPVAQVLLTLSDSENRKRYLNAKNTLEALLTLHVVPIINENDVVATAEIRYGDNDRLAARVAQMASADTLVLLSDIDGLYNADPRKEASAQLIPEVTEITAAIEAMAGDSSTDYGSGGMVTKLAAAKIAMASGCRMVIAQGNTLHALSEIDKSGGGTWFLPHTTPQNARKNWIAQHLKPAGTIAVDAGAVQALQKGKSLLAAGIVAVAGQFGKGDAVTIVSEQQQEVARGLCRYRAHEIKKIMGRNSAEIETLLGYFAGDAVVHRNDLVLKF